jgi:hypothetical protein
MHGTFDASTLSACRLWTQGCFVAGADCVAVVRCGMFDGDAASGCNDARAWLQVSASGAPDDVAILFNALSEHPTLGTLN